MISSKASSILLLFYFAIYFNSYALLSSGDSLKRIGVNFKNQGDFSSALLYYKQAQNSYEILNDSSGLAGIYNNEGLVRFYIGDFIGSYLLYKKSLDLYQLLDNKNGIGIVNINLGNYFSYEDKNSRKALECYKVSKSIFTELNNYYRLLVINNNIGNMFLLEYENNKKEVDFDSANLYYKNSLSIALNLKNKLLKRDSNSNPNHGELAYLLNQIGGTKMNLGKLLRKKNSDSTLYYYKQALGHFKETENEYKISSVHLNFGNLYFQTKQYQKAIVNNLLSLSIASKNDYWDFVHGASKNLAQIYEGLGVYDSATYYYTKYISANDSVYNQNKLKEIENLKTKYETEKKDKELLLRQAKIDLTTAEKNRLMYILLVSVLFTLIIIYIYTQRQKSVKKLRKKEAELHTQEVGKLIHEQELKSINAMLEGEEKERKRIAEDLHDRVGSMLSAMRLHLESSNTKAVELLDDTANEVRRISHNLETKVLNRFGLIPALEDLAEKIESSEKIHFELHYLDLDERLDSKLEINVYRIIQELISNTLKHSRASEIIVQVNRIEDQLIISVEDDGIGFNSLEVKNTGMGLNNIVSRTNELNGEMNIDSGKGKGSIITVEIPL